MAQLFLCCNKTYGAVTKYDDGDDDGDNDKKEYGNNNNNVAAGLGSDDTIFDPIMMPWLRLVLAEEGDSMTATPLQPQTTMYLLFVLYHMLYLPYK